MDEDLYDEFGNYIGEDLDSEDEQAVHDVDRSAARYLEDLEEPANNDRALAHVDDEDEVLENQIVLHEDKKYYPSAAQVYGEDVEALVEEEDAQPLSEPLIKPDRVKKFTIEEDELPETIYDRAFMLETMQDQNFVRNVAIIGNYQHGKTTLLDILIKHTHPYLKIPKNGDLRYADTHELESERVMSIKAIPVTLMLQNIKGKSLVCNFLDTPGHVNFVDEVVASIRLTDGVLLVVDAVEGFMNDTRVLIHHALSQGLSIMLVINKMDRLILDLRLPPDDAYFKLKHIIEEVNNCIYELSPDPIHRVSPELGNVCFASATMEWIVSLRSFAKFYADTYEQLMLDNFVQRLWGDIYYDSASRKFGSKPFASSSKRTFVHFVLEPIYKLYSQTLSCEAPELKRTLANLGIVLKPAAYKLDALPLLKLVCKEFFGGPGALTSMIFEHTKSPLSRAQELVKIVYTGPQDESVAADIRTASHEGDLIVSISKLMPSADALRFSAVARILSGTIARNDTVRVLGENYSIDDDEDSATAHVTAISLSVGRYKVDIASAVPGMIVLLDGIDETISKTATVVGTTMRSEAHNIRPLQHITEPVVKIAVEPMNPSELPKMLEGLRKINKSYPLSITKVEESGEHVILGTGELYLDCILHDLRKLYTEIDIKVSDPVTRFCETIIDTSALKCYANTPNTKNRLTMIAEPLDEGIAEDIESGKIDLARPPADVSQFFQDKYSWDLLASRSVWAFGPDDHGPNILQNDTLPDDVDPAGLNQVRQSIQQGFQWGTREGPLCDEPIRNVKFKILDTVLADEPIFRGGGQIIPTARRVCYSSFLAATPRLLEPVFEVTITTTSECVSVIYNVLAKRRGHITKESPIAGTPLYSMTGLIPVIDSFGFETDLRTQTYGRAFCQQHFNHWQIVPGDPLDKDIKLRALETASAQHMARDFMVKTRRRKGLNEDVSLRRYIDDETYQLLLQTEIIDSLPM